MTAHNETTTTRGLTRAEIETFIRADRERRREALREFLPPGWLGWPAAWDSPSPSQATPSEPDVNAEGFDQSTADRMFDATRDLSHD